MFSRIKSLVNSPSSSAPGTPGTSTPASATSSSPPHSSSNSNPNIHKADAAPLPLPSAKHLESVLAELPCVECDACPEDDGDEHDWPGFPRKFDMDLDSEMMGSCKPMHRLALISTSKTDWPHDPASDQSSLAFHLSSVQGVFGGKFKGRDGGRGEKHKGGPKEQAAEEGPALPGVYESQDSNKLTVLASSVEADADEGTTSTLVFPDFKVVTEVPISKAGASVLFENALAPEVGRGGLDSSTTSFLLPYKAVVLLCSHKTRDKRCSIAAPLLESVLTSTLTTHGYTVDNTGAALHDVSAADRAEGKTEEELEARLKTTTGESKEVGIFKISHLGGHRYSGVMIICFPSGAILYYGRVTPKRCVAIVEKTILKGKILPEHLRGGANLRRGRKEETLLDW